MPQWQSHGAFRETLQRIRLIADAFCVSRWIKMRSFPEIWAFEIANSIFVSCLKRRRIGDEQVVEYMSLLRSFSIRVEAQQLWSNVELESSARRWNLSAYDAAYLSLAQRQTVPLATSDEKLRQAALTAGIAVIV